MPLIVLIRYFNLWMVRACGRPFGLKRWICMQPQGAFDPTVQPLVGYGDGLSKRSEVTDEDVQALMPHVGLSFERIDLNEVTEAKQYRFTTVRKRDPQTRIDFNGIAQGMTVDLLAELLQSRGASDFMVEVGERFGAREAFRRESVAHRH